MTFYVGPAERRCVLRAAMVGCVLLSSTPSASAFAASPDEQRDPPRVGTTGILNAGVGWQDNSFIDDSGAGPYFSIGIGGFIQPKWALMLRGSINIATLTRGPGDDFSSEGGLPASAASGGSTTGPRLKAAWAWATYGLGRRVPETNRLRTLQTSTAGSHCCWPRDTRYSTAQSTVSERGWSTLRSLSKAATTF